jgi:hypothetical protein
VRFLSKHGRFCTSVQREINESYATGAVQTVQPQIVAQFHEGGMRPEERELALRTWTFEGSYQELGEVATVPPDYRIGVFDSEQAQLENGWSDEIRERVEQHLVRHAQRFEDVLVMPATMIPPPWPRYDDYTGTPAALVRKLVDEGHSLDAVLTYEKATQKREEIILALEDAISDPDADYEPAEEEVIG